MASRTMQSAVACLLLLVAVSGQLAILDRSTFKSSDWITVTCDADRAGVDARITDILSLIVTRSPANSNNFTLIAQYRLNSGFNHIQNIPYGRNWKIDFHDNGGQGDRGYTMTVLVFDPKAEDAGNYKCRADFVNYGLTSLSYSNRTESIAYQYDILSFDAGKMTVTCDAGRIPAFNDDPVQDISSIEIGRILTNSNYSIVAQYRVYIDYPYKEAQNIPAGRNWRIEMSGAGNGVNNRKTMKVVWSLSDVTTVDAGIYVCSLTYLRPYNSTLAFVTVTQTLSKSVAQYL